MLFMERLVKVSTESTCEKKKMEMEAPKGGETDASGRGWASVAAAVSSLGSGL